MNARRVKWRKTAVACIALLMLGLPGCKPRTNTFVAPPPPEVTVAQPVRKPVTRFLEYTATTEPFEQVEIRARVAGFLDQVNFKPGAAVKKGDLLFVIDPRAYEAEARHAEADLAAREAALRLAELTLSRVKEAARAAAASDQEVDSALAQRDQAKAEVDLARADVATAKLNVEFTQVRAPIDGRISKNLVDVGNLVGAGGDPTVLATIVSAKPVYVTVDTSEADVLSVRRARMAQAPTAEPGQIAPGEWRPVHLAMSDSTEFNIHGHIDYVEPALNATTGTIRVRARFENEDLALIPGLFVRARILLDQEEQVLVPDIALMSDQSGRFALIVNDQNVVELRRVTIGTLDGTMRIVRSGLTDTDRVIINGLQRVRPGVTVKVMQPAQTTTSQGTSQTGGAANA